MAMPAYANAQDLPLLTTKLYIPQTRPELVPRRHLMEWLNADLHRNMFHFDLQIHLTILPSMDDVASILDVD